MTHWINEIVNESKLHARFQSAQSEHVTDLLELLGKTISKARESQEQVPPLVLQKKLL